MSQVYAQRKKVLASFALPKSTKVLGEVDESFHKITFFKKTAQNKCHHNRSSLCLLFPILIMSFLFSNAFAQEREDSLETSMECPSDSNTGKNTYLWKLRSNPPAYLFGTIHVAYTDVWPQQLPVVRSAFRESDKVYVELDMTNSRTSSTLSDCQELQSPLTLRNILPTNMWLRLVRHMDYIRQMMPQWMPEHDPHTADELMQILTENWERMKPMWIVFMLNSLTKAVVSAHHDSMLDIFLTTEAKRLRKSLRALEHPGEQCAPLNSVSRNDGIFALNLTLKYLEDRAKQTVPLLHDTQKLVRHYNCGTLEDVVGVTRAIPIPGEAVTSSEIYERAINLDLQLRKRIMDDRSARMAERILRILERQRNKSLFFAVGVGHIFGNGSILQYLKQANISAQRLGVQEASHETPPCLWSYFGMPDMCRDVSIGRRRVVINDGSSILLSSFLQLGGL